jgi:hypothetical protein
MIKTFVKIGVGIGHTETGGKILRRGYEIGPCTKESDMGTQQLTNSMRQMQTLALLSRDFRRKSVVPAVPNRSIALLRSS